MKMSNGQRWGLTIALSAILAAGCNVGNAPSGPQTPEAIQAEFDKQNPQEQIKVIQSSPASPERKAQLIKAIEDKYHVKAGEAPVQKGTTPAVAK